MCTYWYADAHVSENCTHLILQSVCLRKLKPSNISCYIQYNKIVTWQSMMHRTITYFFYKCFAFIWTLTPIGYRITWCFITFLYYKGSAEFSLWVLCTYCKNVKESIYCSWRNSWPTSSQLSHYTVKRQISVWDLFRSHKFVLHKFLSRHTLLCTKH